jgi:ribosome-associated protein
VRSSGPGGQNVNKVASAVELRFDARRSPSLPNDVATKLIRLAGSRATQDGVIVIFAQRFSSQPRNREDARERLAALVLKAQEREKPRRATKPTKASKTRRRDWRRGRRPRSARSAVLTQQSRRRDQARSAPAPTGAPNFLNHPRACLRTFAGAVPP